MVVDEADTVEEVGTVVSPDLVAVGAAWDDGPGVGDWIAARLGPRAGLRAPRSGSHGPKAPRRHRPRLTARWPKRASTSRRAASSAADAQPLELPYRRYYLWTGPLRSVTALRDKWEDPPSLVWPEDRSWFLGAPIWTNEIAVAGTKLLIDTVVGDRQLSARHATPDDVLDIDD